MNIAMFAWEALEGIAVGGGAAYASRLAAALARAGHRVRLFTRMGEGQAMETVAGGVAIRRCPWDRKRVFCDEIDALAQSFAYYFADSVKTDGPYDVVHCHEWFTIDAGLRAVALAPARLAVSFHSTEWGRSGIWPESGDPARIAGTERRGIEAADAVIAASFWARRKIAEQYHPPDWKCEVVYHGTEPVDPATAAEAAVQARKATGIAPEIPSLLFAGRFSRAGGGDVAAKACRLAAERVPGARFVFIGSGPLEGEMRNAAGPAALFLAPTDGVAPLGQYAAANLTLAPFRRDYSGRAVLPAWAAGKPVAALTGSVPGEFIMPGTNGWIVEENPEALAGIIVDAFAKPAHTAWMGENGRTAAETAFTWDAAAKKLLDAYSRQDRLRKRNP